MQCQHSKHSQAAEVMTDLVEQYVVFTEIPMNKAAVLIQPPQNQNHFCVCHSHAINRQGSVLQDTLTPVNVQKLETS